MSVTLTGDVKLGLQTRFIEDNFTDKNGIGYYNHVNVDTDVGEVKLSKNHYTYGGENSDDFKSLIQIDDGYIIAGNTYSINTDSIDIWLIKIDKDFNTIWDNSFGGNDLEIIRSTRQTSDGGYIIIGYTRSFGPEGSNGWLIKTDDSGNMLWNKTFGGVDSEDCMSVEQTNDGGYIITGITRSYEDEDGDLWLIKTDTDGNKEWEKFLGGDETDYGFSVQQCSDNGFIITGYTQSYGAGMLDLWLIKTDNSGNEQWNKTFGGSNYDTGRKVRQVSDGGYIVLGNSMSFGPGGEDIWLIRMDRDGNETWNRTFGGYRNDLGFCIQETIDDGYIITGSTYSYGAGEDDVWLIKTNSTGHKEWDRTFGGENKEGWGSSIVEVPDEGYLIAAYTKSYGAGDADGWLIKTNQTGYVSYPTGEFASTNLLSDEGLIISIDTFSCITSVPSNTAMKVQFSEDNQTWYDSSGNVNSWDDLVNGSNQIDISSLHWNGPEFYYRINFSSDTLDVSVLKEINLSYTQYHSSGNLESQPFDRGERGIWKSADWSGVTDAETDIKFQLRTAPTHIGLQYMFFSGPDGTSSSYYETSGQAIGNMNNSHGWIQYRAYLWTANPIKTPELHDVSIGYNYYPGMNNPTVTPSMGDITSLYGFTVGYRDKDDDPPAFVQVSIDRINHTMNETDISDTTYSDNKQYRYSTLLRGGDHVFVFYTSDGELTNHTRPMALHVEPGPLDHITVSPSEPNMTTDQYQMFNATGFDIEDNPLSITPYWEASGGETIDRDGNFTPTTPGRWIIYANVSGISGYATVTVTVGALKRIRLFPGSAEINVSESVLFGTKGYDADGNEFAVTPTWEVSGGGTIDGNGNFTAATPGMWTVYANATGISARATVKVNKGPNGPIDIVDKNDTDNDSLPDAWELKWFGNLTYGPGDDPDGDGYTNEQEYEEGTEPDNDGLRPGTGDVVKNKKTWLWVSAIVFVIIIVGVSLTVFIIIRKKKTPITSPEVAIEEDEQPSPSVEPLAVENTEVPGPNEPAMSDYTLEAAPGTGLSGGPICPTCGQFSRYYQEYDCFWCETCRDYVLQAGSEVSYNEPIEQVPVE